jgi:hypothetical protein
MKALLQDQEREKLNHKPNTQKKNKLSDWIGYDD